MKGPRGIYSQIWYFVFDGHYDFTFKDFNNFEHEVPLKGPMNEKSGNIPVKRIKNRLANENHKKSS